MFQICILMNYVKKLFTLKEWIVQNLCSFISVNPLRVYGRPLTYLGEPTKTNSTVFSSDSWLIDYQFERSTNERPLPDFPYETFQDLRTN